VARHIFQACPVWIYTQSNITSILFPLGHYTNTEIYFHIQGLFPQQLIPLLRKLCKNKATGLDKISVRLIHECADLIADSLCSIFNCSIATGIFPEDWKISKIIPFLSWVIVQT
jgi:phosphatidylinositol kinase/protein kinase (PI-3  family)